MKRYMLLFILVLAVAAFGQEGMEVATEEAPMEMAADTAAVDTMAMEEMPATEEAVVEEDSGDALEAMLAEEAPMEDSGSESGGYSIGLTGSYPIGLSALSDNPMTPIFGVVVSTPFGFSAGPLDMGLGVEASYYNFSDGIKGPTILATANAAVLEVAQAPVSVELGVGWNGRGPGGIAGVSYGYAIPDMPIVINPFARANFVMDLELAEQDGNDGILLWISVGLTASYDLGDLF